jgi:hypothetical protein
MRSVVVILAVALLIGAVCGDPTTLDASTQALQQQSRDFRDEIGDNGHRVASIADPIPQEVQQDAGADKNVQYDHVHDIQAQPERNDKADQDQGAMVQPHQEQEHVPPPVTAEDIVDGLTRQSQPDSAAIQTESVPEPETSAGEPSFEAPVPDQMAEDTEDAAVASKADAQPVDESSGDKDTPPPQDTASVSFSLPSISWRVVWMEGSGVVSFSGVLILTGVVFALVSGIPVLVVQYLGGMPWPAQVALQAAIPLAIIALATLTPAGASMVFWACVAVAAGLFALVYSV